MGAILRHRRRVEPPCCRLLLTVSDTHSVPRGLAIASSRTNIEPVFDAHGRAEPPVACWPLPLRPRVVTKARHADPSARRAWTSVERRFRSNPALRRGLSRRLPIELRLSLQPCKFLEDWSATFPTQGGIDGMPTKNMTRRPNVPRVLIAAVQPVAKRLSRMEDLLIEMRREQDRHLRRISRLERQIEELGATIQEQLSRASVAS
jgi:hypothetical protein